MNSCMLQNQLILTLTWKRSHCLYCAPKKRRGILLPASVWKSANDIPAHYTAARKYAPLSIIANGIKKCHIRNCVQRQREQKEKSQWGGLEEKEGVGGTSCDKNEEVRRIRKLSVTNHKPRQRGKSASPVSHLELAELFLNLCHYLWSSCLTPKLTSGVKSLPRFLYLSCLILIPT